MGDLRNKRRKIEEAEALQLSRDRDKLGWTVFHFDLNPKLMWHRLLLNEACNQLMRATRTRMAFWRCPVRGLALKYRHLPKDPLGYDIGPEIKLLHFSQLDDDAMAKAELKRDILIHGIGNYRGLPGPHFREQVARLRGLLTAPVDVTSETFQAGIKLLHGPFQELYRTHQLELRHFLLGEPYPSGPVAVRVRSHGT